MTTLAERYEHHAEHVRWNFPQRDAIKCLPFTGATHRRDVRWHLKVMRGYRARMRQGEA